LPNKIVLSVPIDGDASAIGEVTSFAEDYSSIGGKATAYVCRNFKCELPTTDVAKMLGNLKVQLS
jgi:hypothetical protein